MARSFVLFAAGAAATFAAIGVITASASDADPDVGIQPAAASSSAWNARPITISGNEYHVTADATDLHPGVYTFAIRNAGTINHTINFDGPHIEDATTGRLLPGETITMTLKLSPGRYRVYCRMPNHEAMGMNATIDVG